MSKLMTRVNTTCQLFCVCALRLIRKQPRVMQGAVWSPNSIEEQAQEEKTLVVSVGGMWSGCAVL